ncbi:MAG: DUF493 domain-containing protein [Methylotenera sp.]|nr:DUF493 domain-containing protein [Methylotenera sp.]MDP1755379.1 DUF493 domain-containing protein [Methylotenera sp.]MDP3744253.1 DUF493 domain-containing protein [Methylotenera sp.]
MTNIEPHTAPPLIDFPCDFSIKVMGETQETFSATIIAVIQTIVPTFSAEQVEMRASSAGKYISLTCTVHVISQAQLDDIYRLLSAHPLVKFAL